MTVERTEKGTFVKGKSGNPAGRPKNKLVFTEILRSKAPHEQIAQQIIDGIREMRITFYDGRGTKKYASLSVNQWLKLVEMFLDRIEGKPAQRVDMTSNDQAIQGYAPAINGEVFTPDEWPD